MVSHSYSDLDILSMWVMQNCFMSSTSSKSTGHGSSSSDDTSLDSVYLSPYFQVFLACHFALFFGAPLHRWYFGYLHTSRWEDDWVNAPLAFSKHIKTTICLHWYLWRFLFSHSPLPTSGTRRKENETSQVVNMQSAIYNVQIMWVWILISSWLELLIIHSHY